MLQLVLAIHWLCDWLSFIVRVRLLSAGVASFASASTNMQGGTLPLLFLILNSQCGWALGVRGHEATLPVGFAVVAVRKNDASRVC